MPKEDCKYWDKCYQRNEHHLQKYNHPPKAAASDAKPKAGGADKSPSQEKRAPKRVSTDDDAAARGADKSPSQEKRAPKRQPTDDDDDDAEASGEPHSSSTSADAQTGNGDAAAEPTAEAPTRTEINTSDLRAEALRNIAGKDYMEILHKRIKFSVQAEYDDLLRTNEFIRHKFLVEMPPDFYAFWKFLGELKQDTGGAQLLAHISKQFQLELVGAFEFLAGGFHKAIIREPGDYLRHWRFYYDPPEFQTLFVRRDTGIHYGYWRDTPQDKDGLLIARNDASQGCEFEFVAGNAFDAFLHYLDKDFPSSPFTAALVASTKKALQQFLSVNEVRVESLETLRKARNGKVVARTFHRAGIVVPLDGKSQVGYRPLLVTDAELKQILKLFERAGSKAAADECVKRAVIEKLQPVATAANIALDESDFGTSLELGIDLFCSGRVELHMLAQSLLVPAYTLLKRPQFIAISKAHLERRSRDRHLSMFDLDK